MKRLDFNRGWTVRPLSRPGDARPVALPHDAMRTERRVPASPGERNIAYYEGGDYEYRKSFTLPEALTGKRLTLEFEGVYHNAEVWINGRKAAFRPYGYTNFYIDLNPWLRAGENELRVVARNADQPNSRWYSGTGIYRPVWLWAGEERHIRLNGLRIETLAIDPPRIRVSVECSAPGEVTVDILDGETCLASAQGRSPFEISLPGAALWSPETPKLYTARAHFGNDTAQARFGIRALGWDAARGLTLNGGRVLLRGACIHHDNGILGACSYPEVERRRVRILKQAGYNALRSAHNPCSKSLLDACDELGMLMLDEYVDCWYMHKTRYDYAAYVPDWWRQDLSDMVDKDFNHPCVIMYSTGNEVAESAQEKGLRLQREFAAYLRELDGTRPVTCGINIFFNFLSSVGLGVYSDKKAERSAKAVADASSGKPKKNAVGSEFFNTVAARIGTDFMQLGATLPACDRKTRDVFDEMDIAGYNYGCRRYRRDLKKYPQRLILGTETLIGDTWDFWKSAQTEPRLLGDFVWAGWDYLGECNEGGPEFSGYDSGAPEDRVRGWSFRIDMTGKLTAEADYTRVVYGLEPGPRLAVYPVYETKKLRLSGWQLTRALRSWSWPGSEGRPAEIEVCARAEKVELLVNGKRIGVKKPKKGIARFRAAYQPGELCAVSYDAAGKELGRDRLRTAGVETELRLECESKAGRPGEMLYFRVRYTDRDGEIKPMEKHTVRFEAENGAVIGTANACCSFRGNFAQASAPTYFGELQCVVQAAVPGVLRVTAADGGRSAALEVPILQRLPQT